MSISSMAFAAVGIAMAAGEASAAVVSYVPSYFGGGTPGHLKQTQKNWGYGENASTGGYTIQTLAGDVNVINSRLSTTKPFLDENITFGAATLKIAHPVGFESYDRKTIGFDGGNLMITGNYNLTLGGSTLKAVNLAGDFTKIGSGTLTLENHGAQPYAGSMTIQEGKVNIGLSSTGDASHFHLDGGTFKLFGNGAVTIGELTGTAGLLDLSSSTNSATLTVTQTTDGELAVPITGVVERAMVKRGGGVWTLSGHSNYLGATTVLEGVLNVTGSLDNTPILVTGAGADAVATLAGSGTIGSASGNANPLIIGDFGRLSVGDFRNTSPATLTLSLEPPLALDVSAAGEGALAFDLGADTAAGESYDTIRLTSGYLKAGDLRFGDFAFNLLEGFGNGTYTLIDAGAPMAGTLDSAVYLLDGHHHAHLEYDPATFDLLLVVTTPEPGISLTGGVAALCLASRRQRTR